MSDPRRRHRAALALAALVAAGVAFAPFACWDSDEQAAPPGGAGTSLGVSAPRTSPRPRPVAAKAAPSPEVDPARDPAPPATDPLPAAADPQPAPSHAPAPLREVVVRLVDTEGNPASNASFVLIPNGPRFQDPNPDRRRRTIRRARQEFRELLPAQPGHSLFSVPAYHADAEGRLVLRPPPTESRWKVDSTLWPEVPHEFVVPPDTWLDLSSSAAEVVLIVLRKTRLTLLFPDRPGAPQPTDWVEIRGDVRRIESRVRPDRSVTQLVGPGALELEVIHIRSGRSWTREVRLEPGADATLTLDSTSPGVTTAGVVLGEAGPLEGALVRPVRWGRHTALHGIEVESAPRAGAHTDAAGRFTLIGDRAPGQLRISAEGYLPHTVPWAAELRATLERKRELAVRLARPPSGRVSCTLTRADGRGSSQLNTGSATPTFTDVRPGRYRLVVTVDGEQPRPAVTVVVPADQQRVEVLVP